MFRGCVCGSGRPSSRPQELAVSPEGAVFGAGKSGRSLQVAAGCEYLCARASVRVARPGSPCVTAVCLHDEEIQGSTGGTGRGLKETCSPCVSSASFPRVTFFAHPVMLFSTPLPGFCTPPHLMQVLSSDSVPEDVPLLPEGIPGIRWLEGLRIPPPPPGSFLGRHSRGRARGVPQLALLPLQVTL